MFENTTLKSILRKRMKVRTLWRVRVQYINVIDDDPQIEEDEIVILAKDYSEAARKLLGKIKEKSENEDDSEQPRFGSLIITSLSQFDEEVFV
jgi:hypothetical protein